MNADSPFAQLAEAWLQDLLLDVPRWDMEESFRCADAPDMAPDGEGV